MELQSYNTATNVATFLVLNAYSSAYFGGWVNDPAKTDFVSEITADGTIYAAERATTFQGMEIHAQGVHIENGLTPTTLFDGYFGTPLEGIMISRISVLTVISQIAQLAQPLSLERQRGSRPRNTTSVAPFLRSRSASARPPLMV